MLIWTDKTYIVSTPCLIINVLFAVTILAFFILYHRVYMPAPIEAKSEQEHFADFSERAFDFIRFYGLGEILYPSVYGKVKRLKSDYIF